MFTSRSTFMWGSFHFSFLVTLNKKRKNQLSFSDKMWIFTKKINNQDKKRKNGMNRTLLSKIGSKIDVDSRCMQVL